ncbi:nuclear transport factor 2 family protein [Novosphingobium sp. G106]|uniref:nuclear transport factor 2 family protein n=1 Tax=Novosphingobium sp. G106 TaxID=2849500 RepID=UPI001C2D3E5D|nr:nuclear transport factor 2 family protein [Novosphingobium sp. G106]MBV1687911.1 nuclear transport factor 2 family protein [Novosphingobium sp. G106]
MAVISDIEKLMALEEIGLLKARRDFAADTKDWALYESLHAVDHVSENGDYGRWTTAAEMIANVRKSMENLTTMHHSHTPEIEFESATRARGIWAMTGLSIWRQGEEDHWFRAFGHYFETYEKRDGRWVFTSRLLKYYHTMRSPGADFPPKLDN